MSEKIAYDPFESSLFHRGVFRRDSARDLDYSAALEGPSMFVLEFRYPMLAPNYSLAIIGADPALGSWDSMHCLRLSDGSFPLWRALLPLDFCDRGVEFKLIVIDRDTGYFVAWERGDNRVFNTLEAVSRRFDVVDGAGAVHYIDLPVVELFAPVFDLALWRGRGVALPLFSLRTERSWGVGDFSDLRSLVDWASDRELSVVQLLPLHDTRIHGDLRDSYPYSPCSSVALHPQYVSLRDVGVLDDEALMADFERRAAALEAKPLFDYEGVNALKDSYLRAAFRCRCGSAAVDSDEYRDFLCANGSEWLDSYALYRALGHVKYGTYDHSQWGDDSKYSPKLHAKYLGLFALDSESRAIREEFDFQRFVQYHLHRQLSQASDYARSRRVSLKGDLTVGVDRCSVDCWLSAQLFNLSLQAGAPPDSFSVYGQNWGFPTYDWDAMAADGYGWWVRRLRSMAQYFDLYRIDHILGFFRIWSIPVGSLHAQLGHYSPAKALSVSDIESFGFSFDVVNHTTPYITDELLDCTFDLSVRDRVRVIYFVAEPPQEEGSSVVRYRFKREYSTQALICSAVSDLALREQLLALHDDVLFVEDSDCRGCYHPRIDGSNTLIYSSLPPASQAAFDAIYQDFFFSRNNQLWLDSAAERLSALLGATDMLACGEDLGSLPAGVSDFLRGHQILTLEVERMAKEGLSEGGFGVPSRYPYLSVATTSTHDTSSLRGWWEEDRTVAQRYYNDVLGLGGIAPLRLSSALARRILDRYEGSPSMLTILPWADLMAADCSCEGLDPVSNPLLERINDPSSGDCSWRYRMPQTLK